MNRSITFLAGVLTTVLLSLCGLVLIPNWKFRELQPVKNEEGVAHPIRLEGVALYGRQVYIEEGCLYCHSQQVRAADFGADIDRGWGVRRSVARDYLFDRPHLMGTMRTGPDLANIGARQPSRQWHYLHLYNPQLTSPGSIMPPFRFLFTVEPRRGDVPLTGVEMPGSGGSRILMPTDRAQALVEYLMSLDQSYDLPEAHQ